MDCGVLFNVKLASNSKLEMTFVSNVFIVE